MDAGTAADPAGFLPHRSFRHGAAVLIRGRAGDGRIGAPGRAGSHYPLYSAGGLCADAKARSAVIAVRDCCHSWGRGGGAQPPELFALRDVAINFLRLDLELVGLTSAVDDQSTALDKLGEELRRLDIHKDRRGEQSTDRN